MIESDGLFILTMVLVFLGAWLGVIVCFTWGMLALLGDTEVGRYLIHGLRHDKTLPNIICCVGVLMAVAAVAILAYAFFFMVRYSKLFASMRECHNGRIISSVSCRPWDFIAYLVILSVAWLVVVGIVVGVIHGVDRLQSRYGTDSNDFV